ncbi:hypothetical protein P261_00632 [Lachnospiraceae bacterium TWA4]|nr:hypothetical protein P261_00632 [Lachnospiraceae bacterium TWA4]
MKVVKRTISLLLLVGVFCMGLICVNHSVSFGQEKQKNEIRDVDTHTEGFTSFNQIQEEYLNTIKRLNWPKDFTCPKKLEGEETDAIYQLGYGDTRASYLWESAWMKEWLECYKTDTKRANKALSELEKAFSMSYMSKSRCDDATRKHLRKLINQAKAGDATGFESEF